jgi:hypothetical protein
MSVDIFVARPDIPADCVSQLAEFPDELYFEDAKVIHLSASYRGLQQFCDTYPGLDCADWEDKTCTDILPALQRDIAACDLRMRVQPPAKLEREWQIPEYPKDDILPAVRRLLRVMRDLRSLCEEHPDWKVFIES